MRLCIAADFVAAAPCCWLQISLLLAVLVKAAIVCSQRQLVAAAPGCWLQISLLLAVRSQLLVEAAIVLKLYLGQINTIRIIILYIVLKY